MSLIDDLAHGTMKQLLGTGASQLAELWTERNKYRKALERIKDLGEIGRSREIAIEALEK